MTKKYNYVDDFDKRYITTYTLKDGGTYTETSYNYPDLANYICPHCGTYPMKYHKVDLGEWDGWRTEFGCVACMSRYEEGDKNLKPAPIIDFDDIVEVVSTKDVKLVSSNSNIKYTEELLNKTHASINKCIEINQEIKDSTLRFSDIPNIKDYLTIPTTPITDASLTIVEPSDEIYLGNKCIICGSHSCEIDNMICQDCKDAVAFAKRLRNVEK